MIDDRQSGNREPSPASLSGDSRAAEKRLEAEKQTLSDAAADARHAAAKEARALGAEAQHAAEEQADKVKEAAASHLDSFADALRAASDELGKNQTGPAAEMVSHAASGLEGLSRSLHGRSTGEMIDQIRRFGRDNPIGFLAGSVLAGLALGRFTAAASAGASDKDARQGTPREPSDPFSQSSGEDRRTAR